MRAGAAVLCFLIASAACASAQTLVYRVDHATAVIESDRLVVKAQGAVRSGGWDRVRLVVRKALEPEKHEMLIEFIATPPGNKAAVVQAIMPIKAKLTMCKPHYGTTRVKIVSETNSVTAHIVVKKTSQRVAGK